MAEIIKEAFAEGTWANMKTHALSYHRFCIQFHLDPLPLSQQQLMGYIAHLATRLRSQDSIMNYVSSIKTISMLMGYPRAA